MSQFSEPRLERPTLPTSVGVPRAHIGRHNEVGFGLVEAGLLAVLAVYLVRIGPAPLAVFATGFAASALEVVLLVALQILAGSLYERVALVVTMFMLGLGIGSFVMNRLTLPANRSDSDGWDNRATTSPPRFVSRNRGWLICLLAVLAVYAACLPAVLTALGLLEQGLVPGATPLAVLLLALLLAVMVGMSFPLAASIDPQQNLATLAGRLYTADYVGASIGALLVSTLLIPLAGVAMVCTLTAGLVVFSALVLVVTWKMGLGFVGRGVRRGPSF